MASFTHEVIVLGGNFAGINIIHYLQRQVFPVLERLDSTRTYRITLVSPNTHFFFKVAAPRALTSTSAIPADNIFKSIPEALQQYGETCTFLRGKAISLEVEKDVVNVEVVGGGKQALKYHSLFICTGTTSASPLWSVHDDHKTSVKALEDMAKTLPNTNSVLIGGAGPVGVETAGEIASAHPHIKITLVAGGDVLEKLKPGVITKAKKLLADAKVTVTTNVRVKDVTLAASGATTVELSDGSSKNVDLFIDARGPSKINSEFLPTGWLDSSGRILTSDNYFRVKGNGSDASGIYVLGDIVAGSDNTALELDAQVPVAASSFAVDIARKLGHDSTSSGGLLSWIPGFGSSSPTQKEFKPMKGTIVVPIGPSGGVGSAMGYGMPSFMVKKAKAEKFLVELVEPAVSGSKYAKL